MKSGEMKRIDHDKMIYILQKDTLTVGEACIYLGISTSFMYKLTSARLIPHSVPNGKVMFFERLELDKWALKNKRKCREEIEKEAQEIVTKNHKRNN